MKAISLTTSNLITQSQYIPLIICPNCKKRIPNINIFILDYQMSVYFKCYCSKQGYTIPLSQFIIEISTIQKNNKANILCGKHAIIEEYYCIRCNMWLCLECFNIHKQFAPKHCIIGQELNNVQCDQHQKPYSLYCTKCNVNMCIECKSEHEKHYCFSLRSIILPKPQLEQFTYIMKNNEEYYTTLINRLNNESELPDDLQSYYIKNQKTNDDLCLLYLSICRTLSTLKLYPSYELIKLQLPIEINKTKYEKDYKLSLVNECKTLIEYFKTNFIYNINWSNSNDNSLTMGHGTCILELRDGRIAFGSSEGLIILWDQTKTKITTILQNSSSYSIKLIELSDSRLVSASYDCTIILWNTLTNQRQATLKGHKKEIVSIVELNDGLLASNCKNWILKLWNITEFKCIDTLTNWETLSNLLLLSDGRLAYSSLRKIILLNTISNEQSELRGYSNIAKNLIELRDGRLAFTSEKTINLWNIATNQCIGSSKGNQEIIFELVELNDGRLGASVYFNSWKIWNTITLEWVTEIRSDLDHSKLIVLNDGRLITRLSNEEQIAKLKPKTDCKSLFTNLNWCFIDVKLGRLSFES